MGENRLSQLTGSLSAQNGPASVAAPLMAEHANISASNEGVIIRSSEGEIVWCNGAACRLLQLDDHELLGRTEPELERKPFRLDGTPWSSDEVPWRETSRTGVPVNRSVMGFGNPDGTAMWLSVDSKPATSSGEPVIVTLLLDVTTELNRRAELDEAMHQIAESMFQTKLPISDHVHFAAKTRASATSATQTRDFCGVHPLGDGRYAFFLGGIKSQRTEEACVNSFVRHTLRSAGALLRDPHEVLFHLHDAIEGEWPETSIEAIFGYVDIDSCSMSAEVRVACSGLPEPTMITKSGIKRFGRNDSMIGDMSHREEPVDSIKMSVGDRLVLCNVRGFTGRALKSQHQDRCIELGAHEPVDKFLDEVHDVAADAARDHESDRDISVLVVAFG